MILTPALKRIAPVAGVVVALTVAVPAWSKTQIGILNCDTSIGIGKILMRKQTMTCVFTHSNGKDRELLPAPVREYGLEVGMVKEGHLAWAVVAGTPMKGTGLLAGKYAGATASVAAGLGLGADVLVRQHGRHACPAARRGRGPERHQPLGRRRAA
jgi:hypothetical protein